MKSLARAGLCLVYVFLVACATNQAGLTPNGQAHSDLSQDYIAARSADALPSAETDSQQNTTFNKKGLIPAHTLFAPYEDSVPDNQAETSPATPIQEAPQEARLEAEPAPVSIDTQKLIGLNGAQLTRQLGPPRLIRRDGPAEVWLYQSGTCTVHFYLYVPTAEKTNASEKGAVVKYADHGASQACRLITAAHSR